MQFILKRDKKERFIFSSLQSETAKKMLADYHFSTEKLTTIVLIENGKMYTHSTAVLRIAKQLGGGWKLLYAFIIIPKFLRDGVYGIVSKYRYRVFGKKDECMIPTPELKRRFL